MQDTLFSCSTGKHPDVSIIMATFNRAHFLEEALTSIIAQSFRNWECLIIDDGSIDNTKDVLALYMEKDRRIKYYPRSEKHKKGLPGCRNQGLELAKGNYVIFFDDDDVVHPQNLEHCMTVFRNHNLDFCSYHKQPFFDDHQTLDLRKQQIELGQWISKKDMEPILKNEIPLASCTVMWKRECFKEEKFNENLMYAEEWECYSRIISNDKIGVAINNILYFNRKHSKSNTGEFWEGNKIRIHSKRNAVNLVLLNLRKKYLLTPGIAKHFISLGFSLKDVSIINNTLNYTDASLGRKLKFFFGYHFYFIIKPIFNLNKLFRKI